jgi:hypothetical protein
MTWNPSPLSDDPIVSLPADSLTKSPLERDINDALHHTKARSGAASRTLNPKINSKRTNHSFIVHFQYQPPKRKL